MAMAHTAHDDDTNGQRANGQSHMTCCNVIILQYPAFKFILSYLNFSTHGKNS